MRCFNELFVEDFALCKQILAQKRWMRDLKTQKETDNTLTKFVADFDHGSYQSERKTTMLLAVLASFVIYHA